MAAQTGIKITSDTTEFQKGLEESKKATGSFRTELRNAKKDALNLTHEFRSLSDELKNSDYGRNLQKQMQDAIKKAADLQDTMADTNREIQNLASDTKFSDGMNMMAGAIGNVATAAVTLTGNSKEMKEVLMDIAKIQATVNAVKSLTNAFQKQNLVLLKNPYVLVASAIAALGVTIYEYCKNVDTATQATKNYKDELNNLGDAANIAKYSLSDLSSIALNNTKIQDAVTKFNELGQSIADLQKRQQTLRNWEKWYHRDIDEEYESNQKEIQNLKEQQQFQQNLLRKYQGENKLIEDSYKKQEDSTKKITTNIKTATDLYSKMSAPKIYNAQEIAMTLPKASIKGVEVDASGLEVVTPEIKDKYLKAMTLLGEGAQKAFWDAVDEGKGYDAAFNIATELKEQVKQFNNVAQAAGLASEAFSALGQSFELPVLNIMGTLAQAIATISLSFAEALSKSGKLGVWNWIAAGVTGLTTLATIISQIKSMNGFASGGIIHGATTIGDFNLARVNDGEMILNGRQQQNLFNMMNNGIERQPISLDTSNVTFKLRGQELIGLMKNTNKINSKI